MAEKLSLAEWANFSSGDGQMIPTQQALLVRVKRQSVFCGLIASLLVIICVLGDVAPATAQPGGDDDGYRGRGRRGGFDRGGGDRSEFIERMRERMEQFRRQGGGPPDFGRGSGGSQENGDRDRNGNRDNDESDESSTQQSPGVERPPEPPNIPDPRELEVTLDEDGRVPPFAFVGQRWPDVLQWLANLYDYSLDWQEMPADYLNLVAEQSLTPDEVRNLINRHLLARGFTTLVEKDVISVFRINKVEPSLVPRITEDELYDLRPYEFAKVSFEIPAGLEPNQAAEDVKNLLSPSARVLPLVSTRRLLLLDAVANLRDVSALLNEERSVEGVPREFVLRHARADKAIETLYVVLGINPDQRPQQMDVRLQRQRWEAIEELAQRGGDVRSMIEGPKVHLAYNPQRNSVLANAPPDQMRIIAQTVRYLDVPVGGPSDNDSAWPLERSPQTDFNRVTDRYLEQYQLVTADPDRMLITLQEVGGLSPWTELRTDPTSRMLFVRATPEDQQKVRQLLEDLDGAARTFHVIRLRRLPADDVAVTVQELFGSASSSSQDEEGSRWGRGRGFPFFFGRRDEDESEKEPQTDAFRVSADVENNRLLLWANDSELNQVRSFLTQLGEADGSIPIDRFRVIDVDRNSTQELLESLKKAWTEDNLLIIDGDQDSETPADAASQPQPPPPRDPIPEDRSARHHDNRSSNERLPATTDSRWESPEMSIATSTAQSPVARFVQNTQTLEADDPPTAVDASSTEQSPAAPRSQEPSGQEDLARQGASSAPPVKITTTPDGRIVVSSEDPEAVARIEELIRLLQPKKSPFETFELKHVDALSAWLQLTEFFQDELGGAVEDQGFGGSSRAQVGGLADRRSLRILYDSANNFILVADATPTQLFEIRELIDVLDQPRNVAAFRTHRTAIIPLSYSHANDVATTLKDVYRDLLSSRDRAFQNGDDRQQESIRMVAEDTVIRYGLQSSNDPKQTAPIDIGFDGALSVGVNEAANAVIICAQEQLFDAVVDLVRELDDQARVDTTIVVRPLNGALSAPAVQAALATIMGTSSADSSPEQQVSTDSGSPRFPGMNRRGENGFRGQAFDENQARNFRRQFGGGQQFGNDRGRDFGGRNAGERGSRDSRGGSSDGGGRRGGFGRD